MSATLIGTGVGTDTLTITLTSGVPATGQLHVVFAELSLGVDGPGGPIGASDTNSNTWITTGFQDSNSYPLVGLAAQRLTSPPFPKLQTGSVARGCSAGDLSSGNSVTVDFRDGTTTTLSIGLLVYTNAVWGHAVGQQGGSGPWHITYGNGDNYPDLAASDSALAWLTDPFLQRPKPDNDATMITAMSAYGSGASFTPTLGTRVGSLTSGSLYVACSVAAVTAATLTEPGGSFGASQTMLAGNYQFLQPGSSSVGIHAWQRL